MSRWLREALISDLVSLSGGGASCCDLETEPEKEWLAILEQLGESDDPDLRAAARRIENARGDMLIIKLVDAQSKLVIGSCLRDAAPRELEFIRHGGLRYQVVAVEWDYEKAGTNVELHLSFPTAP